MSEEDVAEGASPEREACFRRDSLGLLARQLVGDRRDPFSMDGSALAPLLDLLRADGLHRVADAVAGLVVERTFYAAEHDDQTDPADARRAYGILQDTLHDALSPVMYDPVATFRFLENLFADAVRRHRIASSEAPVTSQVTVHSIRVPVDPSVRVGMYVVIPDGRMGLVIQNTGDGYADIIPTAHPDDGMMSAEAQPYTRGRRY